MSRSVVNLCLDVLLLLIFISMVWVSVVLRFVFPPPNSASGWKLWGHGYDGWSDAQFGLLAAMALGVLVHVMLHWSWICGVLASRCRRAERRDGGKIDDGTRTLYGVATLIVIFNLLGLLIAAAALSIHSPIHN